MEDSVGKCLSAYYCTGSASVAVERERERDHYDLCKKSWALHKNEKEKGKREGGAVSPKLLFCLLRRCTERPGRYFRQRYWSVLLTLSHTNILTV